MPKAKTTSASSAEGNTPSNDPNSDELSYPALLVKQNSHRFYFATIHIDRLMPLCFVARRTENARTGFQRTLNEERSSDIGRYLAVNKNSIPTNIVLSAQGDAGFRYERKTKTIYFDNTPNSFLVLDGQHRLWGYDKCKTRHRVPVAIYEGLGRADETRLFIDINTNQRGVPAALLLDIKKLAQVENQSERILRDIFDRLNKDPQSPLAGKLSPAKTIPNKVSRVTFNRALAPILASTVLIDLEQEDRYRLIRNYLSAFDAELDDKSQLVRSAVFEALFALFDEAVRHTINTTGNAKKESLQQTLRPIARLDLTTARDGRTRLTPKSLSTTMQAALRTAVKISSELL